MREDIDNIINSKKSLFSFAIINKYYLFPFLAPIFCCLYRILAFKVAEENKEKNLDLFFILFIEASYLIGGLLYFISPVGSMKEKNKTTR